MLWFTLRQLKSKNAETRRRAAFKLGAARKRGAVPALAAALSDPDWGVRHAAVEALGRIGDPRASEPLIVALHDPDWTVRSAAATALLHVGDAQSLDALIGALKSSDEFVRLSAVKALARIGGRRAAHAVASMLRDDDPAVHQETLKAIAALGWRPSSPAERAWLVVGQREWEEAIKLGGIAVPALGVALDRAAKKGGGGWVVGVEAARALGEIGEKSGVPALVRHLSMGDDPLVKTIALALGRIGDTQAIEPLLGALGRRNAEVRAMVLAALVSFGDRVVEPAVALLAEYRSQRPDVLEAVIALLGRVGDTRALEPLLLLSSVPRFAGAATAAVQGIVERLGVQLSAEQMARLSQGAVASATIPAGPPDDRGAEWKVA